MPRSVGWASATCLTQMPEVPTLNELGYTGMEDYTWVGIFAPAGTQREIVQKLNGAVLKALQAPEMRERLDGLAFEAIAAPLKETADYVRVEVEKWGRVVRETKATVD